MPIDNDVKNELEALAHTVSATGNFFNHVIVLIMSQPGFDRQSLINEIENLYASAENAEAYQAVYNNLRLQLINNLRQL